MSQRWSVWELPCLSTAQPEQHETTGRATSSLDTTATIQNGMSLGKQEFSRGIRKKA